ncbi:hypothetical protein BC827DRAFT_1375221 [Russula dissimulans]|nr:hypothetical protein BC827DRAFT_1375221 [Russula dissimulans]
MRTCSLFSVGRHLPLGCRPSLVRSSSVVTSTGSQVYLDSHSQATAAPIIYKGPSKTPTYTSSFASSAARHPLRLQHAHTLTALHTTRELITRILPQSSEISFWNAVLGQVSHEISRSNLTSNGDSVTIVVYAVDEFSGGESLVSALIQDPFSPEAESVRISRRWESHEHDSRLEIEYSVSPVEDMRSTPEDTSPSSSHILLSSSFLASMPSPTRLIELRPTRELSQDNLRLFYTAHIPIILINPLTAPLTTLSSHMSSNNPKPAVLPYPLPPHALLLITSPSPISTSSSVPPAVFELGVSPNRVFLVDPDRALSSIHSLRTNPSDVLHVQRYSDDAYASGLSVLKRQLQSVPTPAQKGEALLTTSVRVLRNRLDEVEAETREAAALARTLRSETSHERADAHRAVFGPAQEQPGPASSDPSNTNKVRAAMAHATNDDVLPVLDTLTWWRVLWAPDEVSWRMRHAIRDAWIGSIASGLLPALAPLPSTQAAHATHALSRAAALPPALRSHVLLNALNQLTHAPSFAVDPRALLRPLEHRLARLDAGPTAALARAAQVLLLRVAGSVGAGAATGAMLLSHGVGEAAGAGLFVVAAGIRWAIGKWDRVRQMWRADWVRVKEAAERDVKAALDQALETQVLIVPTRAAEGIEDIVTRREDDAAQLRGEVDKLDAVISDSQNLEHRSPDHS